MLRRLVPRSCLAGTRRCFSSEDLVLMDRKEGVAVLLGVRRGRRRLPRLTLNRPKALNALSDALMRTLSLRLQEVGEALKGPRCV